MYMYMYVYMYMCMYVYMYMYMNMNIVFPELEKTAVNLEVQSRNQMVSVHVPMFYKNHLFSCLCKL